MIVVDRPGPLALLQDLGRPRLAHLGVTCSGAADRAALRLANRLVGNPEGAAAIECLVGGLCVTARTGHWVTVTGAPTTVVHNETPVGSHTSMWLAPGDTLSVQPPPTGLRNYLAVRGGIVGDRVLGSLSTDVLSGLGPEPLRAGQKLRTGRAPGPLPGLDLVLPGRSPDALEVLPGPRLDWFTDEAWATLLRTSWEVSSESDRVAVRLGGAALSRSRTGELPSEAVVRGAVQVPASGRPLVFGPDHPVTGGYPVIAVLTERAADHAAQLRPGEMVRFTRARGRAALHSREPVT